MAELLRAVARETRRPAVEYVLVFDIGCGRTRAAQRRRDGQQIHALCAATIRMVSNCLVRKVPEW
jgi:hypothetical protein